MRRELAAGAVVLACLQAVPARPEAPKAASAKPARAIPVDAATRKKIHAVFVKHEATMAAFDQARSAVFRALADGNQAAIDGAAAEFDRRTAEVNTAKQSITGELTRAGIGAAVQDQEWKAWLAARDASKTAAK